MIRTRRAGAAGLLALVLGGCGSTLAGGQSPSSSGSLGTLSGEQLFGPRAQQVAAAWGASGLLGRWHESFVAAEPLLREPDWSPRGSLKAAFYGGWVRTEAPLPTVGRQATVDYADGTTSTVTAMGAQAAYDAMVNPRSGECPPAEDGSADCDWVTVTRARPTTVSMQTARGAATVPAWAFTVRGLARPLVQVAVEGVAEAGDFEPRVGQAPTDGRELLLNGQDYVARPDGRLALTLGSGDCDTAITPHILETDQVVVVGGTATGPPGNQACDSMLRLQEVVLPLSAPLGARPVLDAATGRPLLPRVAPRS